MTASPFQAILQLVTYPGGKNGAGVFQTIINLMPPHEVYIEPFLGGGAIMRQKKPATVNVGIDVDAGVIASFRDGDRSAGFGDVGRFQFRCEDSLKFLRTYKFTGRELVYCDPPYMHETRVRHNLYRFEMSDDQHRDLLRILHRLKCRVMVSGYYSPLYAAELGDWNTATFEAVTRGGTMRTEWLWFNFERPLALHDYRYLGSNFRERERIKRKTLRWSARLRRMPELERRALLHALDLASPNLQAVDPARSLASPNV